MALTSHLNGKSRNRYEEPVRLDLPRQKKTGHRCPVSYLSHTILYYLHLVAQQVVYGIPLPYQVRCAIQDHHLGRLES